MGIKWKEIAIAPKDGSEIIVYTCAPWHGDTYDIVWWDNEKEMWWGAGGGLHWEPTHWAKLKAPK